jgi:hypothetical protein
VNLPPPELHALKVDLFLKTQGIGTTSPSDTIRFGGHDRRSSLFRYAVSAYPLRRGSPHSRLFSPGRYDRRTRPAAGCPAPIA